MNPQEAGRGWWVDWPWRLVQTNLRETDMADIDAERYVADLRSFHATVAMINTSGIVASYATAIADHTPSRHLTGDGLAEIIERCHAAGIRVVARTDFSKIRRPLYERHPEWAARRADGTIVEEHGDVHACVNGDYQRVVAPSIAEETVTALDVDGIYFNWAGYLSTDYRGTDLGPCHCEACRERFAATAGLPLPTVRDLDDPIYRRYLAFQDTTLRENRARLHDRLRRVRPDLAIDRAFPAGGFVRQESGTALGRPDWPYGASEQTKWVTASYPGMVSSNSSVEFIDFPVRHVAVSPDLQRRRLAQALANGGGLDWYVIGRLDDHHDRSGFRAVREIFAWHAAHEAEYRGLRSCATVALLTGPRPDVEEHRGWYRVLAELHVPFDVLALQAADEAGLARYRVVVVPGLEAVGDVAAGRLDAFVQGGGALVASGFAASRDEAFEPRSRPALACLGVERVREVRSDARGAYFRIDGRDGLGRLADVDLLYLDGPYLDLEYAPDVRTRLSFVPPGPFGPPERCVLLAPTGEPGLAVRDHGRGRAIMLPWRPGALLERDGHPNTAWFLADVLEHVAGVEPLGGNLPPMVEVSLHRQPGGALLVHLVNLSGHFGWREVSPVPMHDLEVVVPVGGGPASVEALVEGDCAWSVADGRLTIRLPELRLFEALRIGARG